MFYPIFMLSSGLVCRGKSGSSLLPRKWSERGKAYDITMSSFINMAVISFSLTLGYGMPVIRDMECLKKSALPPDPYVQYI